MSELTRALGRILPESFERKIRNYRDKYFRNYKNEPLPNAIYEPSLTKHKISLCTNCMNRMYHLKHTIEENIKNNIPYGNFEFVLVNYNSQDDMHKWVRKHLMSYIDQNYLTYYQTSDPEHFHMSKAKNLAHRLASGDILCNLDGDNFTGKDFAFFINHLYNSQGMDNIFHFKKAPYWGTEGRIVIPKKYFNELGGYDESFYPTGHQDHDFIERAKAYGLNYSNIQVENFLRYLSNSTKEKSSNLGPDSVSYYNYRDMNREKSLENLKNGEIIANKGGMEKFTVYKNFSTEPIILN